MEIDQRFQELDKIINKIQSSTEKELIKAYSQSLKSITAQIEQVYSKYSIDGTLSYGDMVKYNRLKSLEESIKQELLFLTGKNANVLKSSLEEIFKQSYYYIGFILEAELQTKLAYSLLNPDVIKASIQNPISGLTLNDRLIKSRQAIITEIRQQITQGLIQGESYYKMSRRIKNSLEGDATKSIRVAQTESHRVKEEAKQHSYNKAEKMGLEFRKIWVSTLDTRTRDTHAKLDGQVADKDGYFHLGSLKTQYPGGFGIASEDINCRCTTIVRPTYIDNPSYRRARGDDDKGKVIPYTNYEDWYKNRVINSN